MKIIPFEFKTGSENMRIDKEILENAIEEQEKDATFRLYGWSPKCISLGRNQKPDFLDTEFLKSQGIDIVKRLTGGRALLHDNEITYSFVCPITYLKHGESVVESYKEISEILIKLFENLNIKLIFGDNKHSNQNINYCMLTATGADLCYNGKKIIGSAQFRKEGYILQHGSILFDYDKNLLEQIFGEEVSTDSITCLKEINSSLGYKDIRVYDNMLL